MDPARQVDFQTDVHPDEQPWDADRVYTASAGPRIHIFEDDIMMRVVLYDDDGDFIDTFQQTTTLPSADAAPGFDQIAVKETKKGESLLASTPVVVLSTILGRTPNIDEYTAAVKGIKLTSYAPPAHRYADGLALHEPVQRGARSSRLDTSVGDGRAGVVYSGTSKVGGGFASRCAAARTTKTTL